MPTALPRKNRLWTFLEPPLVAALAFGLTLAASYPEHPFVTGTASAAGQFARAVPERILYIPNCAAAQQMGLAPIRRGHPGYSLHLDRDNDGIACEPWPRRF